jgi:hypothetical protein
MKCVERVKAKGYVAPVNADATGDTGRVNTIKSMGIDFDPQAVVPPVLDIVIENTPVLIVIQRRSSSAGRPSITPNASAACGGMEVG